MWRRARSPRRAPRWVRSPSAGTCRSPFRGWRRTARGFSCAPRGRLRKRLARILLLMAEFGKPGEPEKFIPPVTQETLAEMIGTTRSRVSFFMNRFRALGFISYNGRIQVHKSLLNVVLLDQLPKRNPDIPPAVATPRSRSRPARHA